MRRFLLKRLGRMLLVLFAVSLIVFFIFNVMPASDPAARIAGKSASPQLIAKVEETWGFDEPLHEQYLTMMKLVLSGDLVSYESRLDVDEEIWDGLPATFSLCLGAAAIWIFFGVLMGYLAAFRPGLVDRVLMVLSLISISLPIFLVSALALSYLSYDLELFPSDGYVAFSEDPVDWAYHLVLPWTTLALLFIGLYARVLRANLLDAMDEDYVRTARAKGLPERRVRLRHVLRNALLPIVTLLGLDFAALIGGAAIVTEFIFGLEGIGLLAAEAVINLDLPPIMAVSLFAAFFVVALNTAVDIAYTWLDPRIKLERTAR